MDTENSGMQNVQVRPGERLEILYVRLSRALKWERNPKRHDLDGIADSIRAHGFRDAPMWDSTLNGLVGGNGRTEALEMMVETGEEPPRGILLAADDGEWCMPIQFGIDASSVAMAEAFALDHNNLTLGGAELGSYERSLIWDDTYLQVIEDVRGANGRVVSIVDDDLEAIRRARQLPLPLDIEDVPAEERMDAAEEMLEKWGVRYGDIWSIGEHRLMCGDCTNGGQMEALMDGRLIQWMWTDPPYGVDYEGRTKDKLVMESDSVEGLREMLSEAFRIMDALMEEGCPIYLCHPSGRLSIVFGEEFEAIGWHFHETLVWVKDIMVMGHSDYHYQHEPIIYGWKKGEKRPWFGGRTQVSTFQVDRPSRSERHPTIKPIELIMRQLDNSTRRGAIGIDPFCGSGSTVVAAHELGRVCYACDIEPKYCAVVLDRMESLGETPRRVRSS